jgi:hypothetical protein
VLLSGSRKCVGTSVDAKANGGVHAGVRGGSMDVAGEDVGVVGVAGVAGVGVGGVGDEGELGVAATPELGNPHLKLP